MKSWQERAVNSAGAKLARAETVVANCENALKRKLSDGERRDLLKDNTSWDSEFIAAIVSELTP